MLSARNPWQRPFPMMLARPLLLRVRLSRPRTWRSRSGRSARRWARRGGRPAWRSVRAFELGVLAFLGQASELLATTPVQLHRRQLRQQDLSRAAAVEAATCERLCGIVVVPRSRIAVEVRLRR